MTTKLVLTHGAAMRRKYGVRAQQVDEALRRLVEADRARGLATRVVRLDEPGDLTGTQARPLGDPADPRATKDTVDAVYRALRPDYLMLLDAPDVIPQQAIAQGVFQDEDETVPSDLPYACEAPFSDDARDFTAPTRVVGRLPGITGDGDPAMLVRALTFAQRWAPRSREEHEECFAIAAWIMADSTELSLRNAIGHPRGAERVPPRTFEWPEALLARRTHYINCHGVDGESEFEGQYMQQYPISHSAKYVATRLKEGTVAVVQCCYGAQLYDPREEGSFVPMVNTYLGHGAVTYFGASTTSYGADVANSGCDHLCQFFLKHLLGGASAGRAALEARLEYMDGHPRLDPLDLKTLVQFDLFGDPSIHPVKPAAHAKAAEDEIHARLASGRKERRERLAGRGEALREASTVAGDAGSPPPAGVRELLESKVRELGGGKPRITSHRLESRPGAREKPVRRAVHVATATLDHGPTGRKRRVVVIAHEKDGRVTSVRELHARG